MKEEIEVEHDQEELPTLNWLKWMLIFVIFALLFLGKCLNDHYEPTPQLIHYDPCVIKSGWATDLVTKDNWEFGIKPE